jgi:hypothetical protein
MRTRQQEHYRYNGLSPREFGERTSQSEESVRQLIEDGWFDWIGDGLPECLDVRKIGGQRPEYRIHPSAVARYHRERAMVGSHAEIA